MTTLTDKVIPGKRKTSIARIRIKKGTGKITVNGKTASDYFKINRLIETIKKPIALTEDSGANPYDITARITGGGISGQANALKHAIARAISIIHPNKKKLLKDFKLTTRDARKVQRKMFGHKKARKSFQFSKR
ncbi:30S ribosomal protein S9 [Spirochaetota bacterium]|nr:30S ribosomal protein S9 [Spirochaetota bacterium]